MAADGMNQVRINLVEADRFHVMDVELPYEEAGDVLTVEHLSKAIQRTTGIPPEAQRISFRGKELSDGRRSLKAIGVQDNSRIHLMQRPMEVRDHEWILRSIESAITATNKKLSAVIYEADGIHRGHLPYDYHTKKFVTLRQRLADCSTELKEHQERLNVLDLQHCECDIKDFRRNLTRWIETLHHRIEGIDNGLRDVMTRIDQQHGMQKAVAYGTYHCR